MTTKFAVFNPIDGSYQYAITEQERNALVAQVAWAFFLSQVHNCPYSVVTVNPDGSESWSSSSGEPMMSPEELLQAISSGNL